jgi:hypothetical protein
MLTMEGLTSCVSTPLVGRPFAGKWDGICVKFDCSVPEDTKFCCGIGIQFACGMMTCRNGEFDRKEGLANIPGSNQETTWFEKKKGDTVRCHVVQVQP